MKDSNVIQPQTKYKILLVGDNCEDVYQYGTVDRISPEAPVPVFKFSHEERKPGMAGNVLRNLEALGCEVNYLYSKTSTKTRIVDLRSRQQIVRIDHDVASTPIESFTDIPDVYDAVIISDYNKGTVTYEVVDEIRKSFRGPVFMDTKKPDLACFHGIFVKINELEYNNRCSINDQLIVTLGSKGAMFKTGRDPRHETVYSCPQVEVVDVTGAGDTFLSAFAFEFLRSKSHSIAIDFANRAAGITVQHFGVYAPTLEEIR